MKQDIKIEADQIGQVNVNSTVYNLDKLKNLQPESKEQFIEAVMEIRSVIRKMEEDGRINAEKAADIDHSLHKVKIEAEKPDPSKVKIKKYLQQVRKLVEEVSPYTSMTADLITIIAPIILVLDKIF